MDAVTKFIDPKFLLGLFSFNLGAESLFGLLVFVALLLWGLSLGKTKILISILAAYVGYGLTQLFPFSSAISEMAKGVSDYYINIGLFVVMYIFVFLVFNFSLMKKRASSSEFSLWQILLFNILQIGFMAGIIFSYLPQDIGVKFLGSFYWVFGSAQAVFVWTLLPLLTLLLGRSFIK
jgi:hypothetical protein